MKGKRRGALIRCIAFLLCACFFAALMPAAPAKAAAKNQGTLANLVICIRFSDSDDAHDIFANATLGKSDGHVRYGGRLL